MSRAFWLRTEAGTSRRITPAGLLLGRAPGCDVVLASPSASRRQALVHLDEEGVAIAVMGKGEVTVDGAALSDGAALPPGATLEVGGARFTVVEEAAESSELAGPTPLWVLKGPSGSMFSIEAAAFSIGGDQRDDLRVEGLPPRAVVLLSGRSGLEVAASAPITLDGAPLEAEDAGLARAGSALEIDGRRFEVVAGGDLGDESTVANAATGFAAVRLEFMPRGGRLHVDDVAVYLSERRCDFVAVLLAPPAPLQPGDAVPDELMWSRVWGEQPAGRKTLNVLMHRLRRDLDRAGLDGAGLIERVEGGGATRFVLPDGASATVE
ncbi:MAG: FHA domain-containing protein [Myxococcota bacterium]|nr:FHA domain-containing protein [Myxococcota bacterium]